MVFTIRQNSTLPILKLVLYRDGRNDYEHFEELLENSIITFAMKDEKTGIYKISNKEAIIKPKLPCANDVKKEYYIVYEFTSDDTNRPGIYLGEFKIIFIGLDLQPTGELIIPISEQLYIHVIDSFVKSDVSYIT